MLSRLLVAAILIGAATQAFAEPRHAGRYDMVRLSGRHQPEGKVLILDRKTGQMWTWSEHSLATYSGQIFPITADGSFARILHVPQDKR
ncbi:hypothetical protein [Pseudolabrys taiwanensis]|nr:hypothetical protein [Pseudolabrys taiwanensis]